MILEEAQNIADRIKSQLAPHCERIEIAGSIRRKRPNVKDIEIVCTPKPYDIGMFSSGIATVINQWDKVKGELPCKYTQRILPEGIKLDIFFTEVGNWGNIFAIRTGSADFSHKVLASGWVKAGYKGVDGYLTKNGKPIAILEEEDLFRLINMDYIEPKKREYHDSNLYR